jgi:hypothetical protein
MMRNASETKSNQTLRNLVVRAVSDDYEEFQMLFADVAKFAAADRVDFSVDGVADALESSIQEGLVQAYVLSAQRPNPAMVEFSRERLSELWYYATPEGKDFVTRLFH